MLGDDADATGLGATPTAEQPRVLHSDPHDFAGLYIRHRTAFTLLARRHLRDPRDADDVVQEAFLRLFLALPELETELQALAYCRRTITNLCIDRYRAQARRPSCVDISTIPLEELPDEDPGDPVVRAEDAALVREALSMLSPSHRAALVKREIEEKPLPVIAEELEVPEETVKHLLFRARRALRRVLVGTSLEPGSDGEGSLRRLTRAGPASVVAVLLLAVLGLGSGPDLHAIPVVGVDLPEVVPVTAMAKSVGQALTGALDTVSASDDGPGGGVDTGSETAPQPVGAPAPNPTVAPVASSAARAVPAPEPRTATASPQAPATPAPAPEATAPGRSSPSPSPAPSAVPSGSPSPTAAPTSEPVPLPDPGSGEPAPSPALSPAASEPAAPAPAPEAPTLPARADVPKEARLQEVSGPP